MPDQRGRAARLPWEGRAERADLVIVAAIAISGVYGLALLPLVPALIGSHPVVLELVTSSTLAEVTVGALSRVGRVPWPVALLAGVPASMMFDWAYWWAGHRWGDRALHLLLGQAARGSGRPGASTARQDARAERWERWASRFGPAGVVVAYYLPIPNVLVYAAAGLSGMRLRTFLLLDVIGTLLWVGLLVGLGYALGQRAIDVVHRIDHYSLVVSIGVVALVIGVRMLRRGRR